MSRRCGPACKWASWQVPSGDEPVTGVVTRTDRCRLQMQLGHSHRQLLSRCTLRWYSAGTVPTNKSSDATAASGTTPPSRLKRPLASTFGGIDIRTPCLFDSPISTDFHSHFTSFFPQKMLWCLHKKPHKGFTTNQSGPVRVSL